MKALLLAAAFSAAVPAFAGEAAPAKNADAKPASPAAAAEAAIKELESCVDDLDYFSADLKKKEAELDKEFKGKVPSAFVFLMNMKRGRVSRQQETCAVLVKRGDSPLAPAEAELKELKGDSADYKKKRKQLDDMRGRLNKTFKRFSTGR